MEYHAADDEELMGPGRDRAPSRHNDKPFAVFFTANLMTVLILAIGWGLPNVANSNFTRHHEGNLSHGARLLLILLCMALVGGVVSALWLKILQRYAKQVITYTLQFSFLVFLLGGFVAFLDSGRSGRAIGLLNLMIALAVGLCFLTLRRAIPLAASNLAAASRVLCQFPHLAYTAYGAMGVQLLWICVWSLAVVGVLAKSVAYAHDSTSFGNICFFLLLLSLFWVVQVVQNTTHCIAAGTLGEWWYGAHDAESVARAARRALGPSFGSICFGSLVVAVLNALKVLLLTTKRRKSRSSVNACLECIIRFTTKYMEGFNKFAFCQVAIYGKDFQTAGYDTMRLFRDRGWSAVINDSLIANVLVIGSLLVGGISGVLGSWWLYFILRCTPDEQEVTPEKCETFNVVLLAFAACFVVGLSMCAIVSSVLDSIVSTMFVCFAEDPVALQHSNPIEYERLVTAWSKYKPDLLTVRNPSAPFKV